MFRIGVSRDGILMADSMGINSLNDVEGIDWEYLAEDTNELRPDQVNQYDALVLFGSQITSQTLEGVDRLAIIARLGVGYNTVDVDACTNAGVILTITPDGVRRGLASSAVTFILSLSHNLIGLHNQTRNIGWIQNSTGFGIYERTLGLLGLGNVEYDIYNAAETLGANRFQIFRHITLPLSRPGIVIGSSFVFVMTMGDFVTPRVLGGSMQTIGILVAMQSSLLNWPLASALATVIIIITLIVVLALFKIVNVGKLVF